MKWGAVVAAAPYFVPGSALGQDGRAAPSERVVIGHIGVGGMGNSNADNFRRLSECQIVAAADVDANHLRDFKKKNDEHYGNTDTKVYGDFRELIARDDIDAVCIATPDHWHSIPVLAAAAAKKDIYCEKPISHTFAEGVAMVNAVQSNNRIWQTGSWQRSQYNFRLGAEIVRNGHIGKVQKVEVGLPYGHSGGVDRAAYAAITKPSAVPAELDYDFWIGPAPEMFYCPARTHFHWRWNLNTGGGQLMDWIGHHNDIAHWGIGRDMSGPVRVRATGNFPAKNEVWNSPVSYLVESTYEDGVVVIIKDAPSIDRNESAEIGHYMGVKWIGEDGWLYVDRGGKLQGSNPDWNKAGFETGDVKLYESRDHWQNFVDGVKTRKQTITPIEVSHRSITPGHLAYVSMATGRAVDWDPVNQRVVGDEGAAGMLSKKMRQPWSI